jgi:hypothetical protein
MSPTGVISSFFESDRIWRIPETGKKINEFPVLIGLPVEFFAGIDYHDFYPSTG